MEAPGRIPRPLRGEGLTLQLETDALVLITAGRHCGEGRGGCVWEGGDGKEGGRPRGL